MAPRFRKPLFERTMEAVLEEAMRATQYTPNSYYFKYSLSTMYKNIEVLRRLDASKCAKFLAQMKAVILQVSAKHSN